MNSLSAQTPLETGLKAITTEAVKGQLEFLASDRMEGRGTGTRGEYLAGDYIASMFKIYGIQPFGDDIVPLAARRQRSGEIPAAPAEKLKSFFQNIPLIEYVPGTDQHFSVISMTPGGEVSVDFEYNTDFSVRTGNVGLTVTAPLVFAGYGFTDEKNGYDDYKKLDVNGKVVVILAGFPGYRDENSPAFKKFRPEGRMAQYAIERNKTARAEKLGAAGIIMVRPGTDPLREWAEDPQTLDKASVNGAETPVRPVPSRMALPEDTLSGNIPVFTVTNRVVERILAGTGIDFASFEKQAAVQMVPASALLSGKRVGFRTSVTSRVVNARNVVGFIEGENKDEVIVVGAHYDHMGMNNGWIWNGADDNASGTVGVMTIAKAFAASGKKPERSVVFAAWTGEEKGLLGSEFFVNNFDKNKKLVLNLNYDMIARDEPGDSLGKQGRYDVHHFLAGN